MEGSQASSGTISASHFISVDIPTNSLNKNAVYLKRLHLIAYMGSNMQIQDGCQVLVDVAID